jgi:hypothetical protein
VRLIYGTCMIAGGNHFPSSTSSFETYIRMVNANPLPAGLGNQFEARAPFGIVEATHMLSEPSAFFFSGDWLLRL